MITRLLAMLLLTILVLVNAGKLSSDILELEERLEKLKNDESRVLRHIRSRLLDAGEESISRARRTPEEKIRMCGRIIATTVHKLCPDGCDEVSKRSSEFIGGISKRSGIATRCCTNSCTMSEIKNMCCPS